MAEKEFRDEIRIVAIEYMLALTQALVFKQMGISEEGIKATFRLQSERLAADTTPDVDAAQSDLLAGEIEEAVSKLQKQVLEVYKSMVIRRL